VVAIALSYGAIVFTSDPDDITQLAAATGAKPGLVIRRL
jgi:predicted nucleic acid-binding protein